MTTQQLSAAQYVTRVVSADELGHDGVALIEGSRDGTGLGFVGYQTFSDTNARIEEIYSFDLASGWERGFGIPGISERNPDGLPSRPYMYGEGSAAELSFNNRNPENFRRFVDFSNDLSVVGTDVTIDNTSLGYEYIDENGQLASNVVASYEDLPSNAEDIYHYGGRAQSRALISVTGDFFTEAGDPYYDLDSIGVSGDGKTIISELGQNTFFAYVEGHSEEGRIYAGEISYSMSGDPDDAIPLYILAESSISISSDGSIFANVVSNEYTDDDLPPTSGIAIVDTKAESDSRNALDAVHYIEYSEFDENDVLLFSPDDSKLAAHLGNDLVLIDVATGNLTVLEDLDVEKDEHVDLAFNADGSRLAYANGGEITVYDLLDGTEISRMTITGLDGETVTDLTGLAFSVDGQTLYFSSSDNDLVEGDTSGSDIFSLDISSEVPELWVNLVSGRFE